MNITVYVLTATNAVGWTLAALAYARVRAQRERSDRVQALSEELGALVRNTVGAITALKQADAVLDRAQREVDQTRRDSERAAAERAKPGGLVS